MAAMAAVPIDTLHSHSFHPKVQNTIFHNLPPLYYSSSTPINHINSTMKPCTFCNSIQNLSLNFQSFLLFFSATLLICFTESELQTSSLILPFKTQQIPSGSLPKVPEQASFPPQCHPHSHRPSRNSMVIDTGSEFSCLHCNKTRNYNTLNTTRSTSYSPVPCSSSTCTNRTQDLTIPASCDSNKLCHATLSYAGATNRNSGFGIRVHGFNLSGEIPATVNHLNHLFTSSVRGEPFFRFDLWPSIYGHGSHGCHCHCFSANESRE